MSTPLIVQNITADVESVGVKTFSIPIPTGLVTGNVLLLMLMGNGTQGYQYLLPTGWVFISTNKLAGNARGAIIGKTVEGNESGNLTILTDFQSVANAYSLYEIQGSSLSVIEAGVTATGSYGPNPPSLTLSNASGNNLWIAAAITADFATNESATGYTIITKRVNAEGNIFYVSASKTSVNDTEDPSSFITSVFQSSVAYTIAIPEALSSPAVTVDDSAFEPGKAITGTYANYASAPTAVTLTDSAGNRLTPAVTINDTAKTFSTAYPARITTGTGTTLLRGPVTVELT